MKIASNVEVGFYFKSWVLFNGIRLNIACVQRNQF